MSFIDTVRRARELLREEGRISLRGLKREFRLDDEALEELIEELVDIQQVAAREGKAVAWIGGAAHDRAEAVARPSAGAEPAAQAERRQLTVMFCDLVGSTNLSQRLDAEDLRDVVRAYQESVSAVIERYEGHVAQYLGDGLLVYFGYPQAHEDDAERAVRAGREILATLGTLNDRLEPEHGIRLAARVGIHTGPVVVGEMGGGAKSETLALGDTTNIAARLEAIAHPDSVVISRATLRLVPGLFATKDLGTPALKGIAEPVHAYAVLQATGVRSRLDVDPSKLTPLVGRDQELGLLVERWEQVGEGEGQTVLVSGEAGLGKSRLLQAFREQLAETPHGWLECRCSPYTQGSAFHPLIELMEQGLGIQAGDDPETKLARLEAGLAAAGFLIPEVAPLLAPLLSLPLPDRYPPLQFSPELQRKKTIEALVAWTFGLGESQPAVLLVEDLHWCDASTLEAIGWLVEQNPTAKVLTLLSFRPDFEPPWPARSHVTPLAVKRLSRRQATDLIGGMTHDAPLPGAVVERVVERADGVPLFLEELTKTVLESDLVEKREGHYELTGPIAELAIPATLQDSLMARLDQLDEGKGVAQLGAALGREFFYELLRRVSLDEESRLRAGLAQLVDAELLYQRGSVPRAEFTFKHALIQETAYQSLLRSVRQPLHARIAKVLEEQFPERAEAEPEVIARHYDVAGLAGPAIAHYRRAGEGAMQRSAHEEAIGHLRRALQLLATLPETRERHRQELALQIALGTPLAGVRAWSHPEYEQTFARARELASRIGDAPELARVLVGMAQAPFVQGEVTAAAEIGRQALAAAERTGDVFDQLSAHYQIGMALLCHGRVAPGLRHFEQTLALYDPAAHGARANAMDINRGLAARDFAGLAHVHLGHPDRALAVVDRAVELAQHSGHPVNRADALFHALLVHFERREFDRMRERAEALIDHSERIGLPFYLNSGHVLRGRARVEAGEVEAGVEEMRRSVDELARAGSGIVAPCRHVLLAEGLQKLGQPGRALDVIESGLAQAQAQSQLLNAPDLHRLHAETLLDLGRHADEPEAPLRRALELARRQEQKTYELRAATSLAHLWQRQGKSTEANDLLQPVYDWFTEGFDTRDVREAKALLENLS